jgi:hypothetical protein
MLTNDELQCGLLTLPYTLLQQVINRLACFDFFPVFLLPPSGRAMFGINIALAEDCSVSLSISCDVGLMATFFIRTMLQDVLQVGDFVILEL